MGDRRGGRPGARRGHRRADELEAGRAHRGAANDHARHRQAGRDGARGPGARHAGAGGHPVDHGGYRRAGGEASPPARRERGYRHGAARAEQPGRRDPDPERRPAAHRRGVAAGAAQDQPEYQPVESGLRGGADAVGLARRQAAGRSGGGGGQGGAHHSARPAAATGPGRCPGGPPQARRGAAQDPHRNDHRPDPSAGGAGFTAALDRRLPARAQGVDGGPSGGEGGAGARTPRRGARGARAGAPRPRGAGQCAQAGAPRAKVVPTPPRLKAVLRIPETQAKDLSIGQKASIDTRNGLASGHVARIDPSSINGTVTVDVTLDGTLPGGARPDLSVDGVIEIARLKNVLYTGRPAYGQTDGTIGIFKLEEGGRYAQRVSVRLGRMSVSSVELKDGLSAGDVVILSDMSRWDEVDRVRIK